MLPRLTLAIISSLVLTAEASRSLITEVIGATGCNSTPFGECNGRGHCVIKSLGIFGCECGQGYQGVDCNEAPQAGCPRQCSGHGSCDGDAHSQCHCNDGFEGDACQESMACSVDSGLNFCSGHGSCNVRGKPHQCTCIEGWSGNDCSRRATCAGHCSGQGTCIHISLGGVPPPVDVPTGTNSSRSITSDPGDGDGSSRSRHQPTCACDEPFHGPRCARVKPSRCPEQCSGHGVCVESEGRCRCRPGFSGPTCADVSNLCRNTTCGHGSCYAPLRSPPPRVPRTFASTVLNTLAPACRCNAGWIGPRCDRLAPAMSACAGAPTHHCSGHGDCDARTASCSCYAGFVGSACDVIDPATACPSGCSGRGTCVHDVEQAQCVCAVGWKGVACEESRCPEGDNGIVCSGHGLCAAALPHTIHTVSGIIANATSNGGATGDMMAGLDFSCICDDGWGGDECSVREGLDGECPSPCIQGRCDDGVCVCEPGFTGANCNIVALNVTAGVCCPYNCSDNGICDMPRCECRCNQQWGGAACNEFVSGDENP